MEASERTDYLTGCVRGCVRGHFGRSNVKSANNVLCLLTFV